MSLSTEIAIETMKLEGKRWRLLKKKDRSLNLNEHFAISKEIDRLNIKIEQYQNNYYALKRVKK